MNKTKPEVKKYFETRLTEFNSQLTLATEQIRRISLLRVITFLVSVIGIYFATSLGWIFFFFLVLQVLAFLFFW